MATWQLHGQRVTLQERNSEHKECKSSKMRRKAACSSPEGNIVSVVPGGTLYKHPCKDGPSSTRMVSVFPDAYIKARGELSPHWCEAVHTNHCPRTEAKHSLHPLVSDKGKPGRREKALAHLCRYSDGCDMHLQTYQRPVWLKGECFRKAVGGWTGPERAWKIGETFWFLVKGQ